MPTSYLQRAVCASRPSTSLLGMAFVCLAFWGCGGQDPGSSDASVPAMKDHGIAIEDDAGADTEAGTSDAETHDQGTQDLGPCGAPSPRAGELALCGAAEIVACSECRGVEECGAGMGNFVPIVNCDNCPGRVDSHVCEAGTCRILGAPGALRVRFSIPTEATGARSFIAVALNPVSSRGDRVRCAELMSTCQLVDNPELNATNVAFQLFSAPADPGLIYVTTFGGEAGEDRIVLLIVTAAPSGGGEILGLGCVEDILVGADEPTEVAIEVKAN